MSARSRRPGCQPWGRGCRLVADIGGARLPVMHSTGNSRPALRMAARTRSRLSPSSARLHRGLPQQDLRASGVGSEHAEAFMWRPLIGPRSAPYDLLLYMDPSPHHKLQRAAVAVAMRPARPRVWRSSTVPIGSRTVETRATERLVVQDQ